MYVWYTYSFNFLENCGSKPKSGWCWESESIQTYGRKELRTCARSTSYNILQPQLYHLYLRIALFASKHIEIVWTSFEELCLLPNRLTFRFRTTLWASLSQQHPTIINNPYSPLNHLAAKSALNFVPFLTLSHQRTLQVLWLRMCWCRARHKLHHLL